jgi:hypothetical protein
MKSIRNIQRQPAARSAMILLAGMALSAAMATGALAAGHGGGGHMGGRFRGPIVESVPEMPGPVFNPSTPYTVPQGRETPVSPASPGSVFGNG